MSCIRYILIGFTCSILSWFMCHWLPASFYHWNSGEYIKDSAVTPLHKDRGCFLNHKYAKTCKLKKTHLLPLAIVGQHDTGGAWQ